VVTVKPTVGLISRAGILPISHSQDTAGPLTRTVRDAAILLNVAGRRAIRLIPRRSTCSGPTTTPRGSTRTGSRVRASACRAIPDDPLNDFYMGKLPARSKAVMAKAIEALG